MGYVFISYSSKNKDETNKIVDLLHENGYETWIAPYSIPAGSRYAESINGAIKNASCFLLLFSKESQESLWVAKEVERAINYKLPIFPVRLDSTPLNDEFELYLSSYQFSEYRDIIKDREAAKKFIADVSAVSGPASASAEPVKKVGDIPASSESETQVSETAASHVVPHAGAANNLERRRLRIEALKRERGFDYKKECRWFYTLGIFGAHKFYKHNIPSAVFRLIPALFLVLVLIDLVFFNEDGRNDAFDGPAFYIFLVIVIAFWIYDFIMLKKNKPSKENGEKK